MASPKTILLKGAGRHEEYPADAALKPGHLLILNATGEVLKHATSGGVGECMIAKEDALQGKTIADAYAAGDIVMVDIPAPGDWRYIRIPAAAAAIVKGDFLMSNGDGTFVKRTAANHVFFQAEEAVDNSAGGAEAFIRASKT